MSDGPIYMLNVLSFKPDGGEDRYKDYLRAASPILARYGGRKLDSFVPETAIIGEFDADLIFFVEWPSRQTFESFLNDSEFQAVVHLREEALSNSLLIPCRRSR